MLYTWFKKKIVTTSIFQFLTIFEQNVTFYPQIAKFGYIHFSFIADIFS